MALYREGWRLETVINLPRSALITALPHCVSLACMLPSHDPLPFFIRLIVSQNQAVWARAAGTDWVKSAVDVSNSALYRLTIRIRSDDTIRTNTIALEYEENIQ